MRLPGHLLRNSQKLLPWALSQSPCILDGNTIMDSLWFARFIWTQGCSGSRFNSVSPESELREPPPDTSCDSEDDTASMRGPLPSGECVVTRDATVSMEREASPAPLFLFKPSQSAPEEQLTTGYLVLNSAMCCLQSRWEWHNMTLEKRREEAFISWSAGIASPIHACSHAGLLAAQGQLKLIPPLCPWLSSPRIFSWTFAWSEPGLPAASCCSSTLERLYLSYPLSGHLWCLPCFIFLQKPGFHLEV